MNTTRSLEIKSRFGPYRVDFLPTLEACIGAIDLKKSWFLVDENVHRLYRDRFSTIPAERCIQWFASEENKSYAKIEEVFEKLLDAGFKKSSNLVVVGGGILQDVGGFVASTLFRGVTWDLIPTTLLAQSDSCIGAKTSINISKAKNMLGTFYPPTRVLLTTEVLATLSQDDIQSGLSEAVKLGMVDSLETVEWMNQRLSAALEKRGLDEFLHRALMIKKNFIEEDELDKGIRNLLNFGHTFGHAFESISKFRIPHGIAVGLGMRAAAHFSVQLGIAPQTFATSTEEIMRPLTESHIAIVREFTAPDFVGVMKFDKKNVTGDIMFILAREFGKIEKFPLSAEKAESLLTEFLRSI